MAGQTPMYETNERKIYLEVQQIVLHLCVNEFATCPSTQTPLYSVVKKVISQITGNDFHELIVNSVAIW